MTHKKRKTLFIYCISLVQEFRRMRASPVERRSPVSSIQYSEFCLLYSVFCIHFHPSFRHVPAGLQPAGWRLGVCTPRSGHAAMLLVFPAGVCCRVADPAPGGGGLQTRRNVPSPQRRAAIFLVFPARVFLSGCKPDPGEAAGCKPAATWAGNVDACVGGNGAATGSPKPAATAGLQAPVNFHVPAGLQPQSTSTFRRGYAPS